MAHPKRRISKSRKGKRRTHQKCKVPTFAVDQQSGEPHLWHRVCLESGYYRGRQVMPGKDEV